MKSIRKKVILLVCSIAFSTSIFSQSELLFNDIHLYESLSTVKEKLSDKVLSHSLIAIEEPIFPLSSDREEHLLCTNLKTINGLLANVVFTFADDQLHYVQVQGNATNTLVSKRKDTAITYLDFDVYRKDNLFSNPKNDLVRYITKEAAHTNLFAWQNPYVDGDGSISAIYKTTIEIPNFLKMGADLEQLRPLIEANSTIIKEEKLDGSDPNAQLQLNCFGVEYAGFPRKIEARFGDGKLNTVWILTGKGEEDRLRKKLTAHYGDPIFVTDEWEIFENWTIGLRKDKPEILLLTQELGQHYKKEYFKQ
ncbi:hypothetical protein [Croceitalea rosinachiae]|uniref:DUF2092 domain-containing protein n=1 Tax=Croceitalea rosinachiae TaxID=3075596 RepID=A0ABU3AAQ4_9FLAO|nr:hypothetical protein [Croceitalea sp. F388]MDT0607267.1 hypothetical protein [Croceitalea sp. F388]